MTAEAASDPVILLVEDNLGDVELTRDALEASGVPHRLIVARDGAEAMTILFSHGAHRGTPRPALVLLDLNLPRKDGKEVLAEIKSNPELKRIPVLVYTSSDAEDEIRRCYDLHANAYVTKAEHAPEVAATLRALMLFWLGCAKVSDG